MQAHTHTHTLLRVRTHSLTRTHAAYILNCCTVSFNIQVVYFIFLFALSNWSLFFSMYVWYFLWPYCRCHCHRYYCRPGCCCCCRCRCRRRRRCCRRCLLAIASSNTSVHMCIHFILLKESSDSHCLSIKLALVHIERSSRVFAAGISLDVVCATNREKRETSKTINVSSSLRCTQQKTHFLSGFKRKKKLDNIFLFFQKKKKTLRRTIKSNWWRKKTVSVM